MSFPRRITTILVAASLALFGAATATANDAPTPATAATPDAQVSSITPDYVTRAVTPDHRPPPKNR